MAAEMTPPKTRSNIFTACHVKNKQNKHEETVDNGDSVTH
jgi:hypothetical protein